MINLDNESKKIDDMKKSPYLKGYGDTANNLSLLPEMALLFSDFNENKLSSLLEAFKQLQESSKKPTGLHKLFNTKNRMKCTTRLAEANRLLCVLILIQSNIENEKHNHEVLKDYYHGIYKSYEKLKNIDKDENSIVSLSIDNMLKQLIVIRNNDVNYIESLNNDITKAQEVKGQIKVFIDLTKAEGKQMSTDEKIKQIHDDSNEGIDKTIQAFLYSLYKSIDTDVFQSELEKHDDIEEIDLTGTNKSLMNSDLNEFMDEPEPYVDEKDDEATKIKDMNIFLTKVFNRSKKIVYSSPQKTIPILPLLNLVCLTNKEMMSAKSNTSISDDEKEKLWNKGLKIQVSLGKIIIDYLDNISKVQSKQTEHNLDSIEKAMGEYSAPNFDKFLNDDNDED